MGILRSVLILATIIVCFFIIGEIRDLTKAVDSGKELTEQKDSK